MAICEDWPQHLLAACELREFGKQLEEDIAVAQLRASELPVLPWKVVERELEMNLVTARDVVVEVADLACGFDPILEHALEVAILKLRVHVAVAESTDRGDRVEQLDAVGHRRWNRRGIGHLAKQHARRIFDIGAEFVDERDELA